MDFWVLGFQAAVGGNGGELLNEFTVVEERMFVYARKWCKYFFFQCNMGL